MSRERQPWLSTLLVCSRAVEGDALRAALRARRLTTRSVPSGRGVAAWTIATPGGTLGLAVTGQGDAAATAAASFWAARARSIVVVGASPTTGAVAAPSVVVEGDTDLVELALARSRGGTVPATRGRIPAAQEEDLPDAARASLAAMGVATVASGTDVWRRAAASTSVPVLVIRGVHEPPAAPRPPAGRARPAPMVRWLGALSTTWRNAQREGAAREAAALEAAARIAAALAAGG